MRAVLSRRFLRTSVCALSLVVLAACSSTDTRYDPAPLGEYGNTITSNVLWSVSLGSGSDVGFAPALVGSDVYAAVPSGQVHKVDLGSGRVMWSANAGKRLTAGVGSDGLVTAVVTADGDVVAYDDAGQEIWRTRASSAVTIPPAVGEGVVVVRASDYRIQAFNARNGELLWSVQRPGPALSLKTGMQMRIVDGMLLTGMPNGRLMAINTQTGGVVWEGSVSVSQGATDLERINDVVGAPQVQDPLLCGATYQGRVVCFDVQQGGVPLWDRKISAVSGPVSDSHLLYIANSRDKIEALALVNGQTVWEQDGLRNRRLATMAVTPRVLAAGDYQGYVHFLSRIDGKLEGRLSVGGGPIVSPLLGTDRGVLVQTGNGNLVLVGIN
ncbi:outer membrane protein assembly factor BamB [Alcaligenes endophyticus]|uniref:Outer membrane protein assembly factor BamB n=1 Tax=Alcaligenes endophyticus TaxID=1929088 RepID=A0ABT8EIG6_9BURK|nr:outer membrane protein assembly factor BamB [Alcaligenes endophyticus]MCX5592622.1 outer membrane protein assembly factor BamB [Alcaligenes endophyticus]MDN4121030.1 outer membrane protein assembly factor BamB [Alcaligenes endophyticus]